MRYALRVATFRTGRRPRGLRSQMPMAVSTVTPEGTIVCGERASADGPAWSTWRSGALRRIVHGDFVLPPQLSVAHVLAILTWMEVSAVRCRRYLLRLVGDHVVKSGPLGVKGPPRPLRPSGTPISSLPACRHRPAALYFSDGGACLDAVSAARGNGSAARPQAPAGWPPWQARFRQSRLPSIATASDPSVAVYRRLAPPGRCSPDRTCAANTFDLKALRSHAP